LLKKTSATIFSNHSEEHQRFFLMFQVRTHHVFSPGLVPIIILQIQNAKCSHAKNDWQVFLEKMKPIVSHQGQVLSKSFVLQCISFIYFHALGSRIGALLIQAIDGKLAGRREKLGRLCKRGTRSDKHAANLQMSVLGNASLYTGNL
jgi:hypothetical protein